MSESLFYNRDQNISGIAIPASFPAIGLTPIYGSTVEFSARDHNYKTDEAFKNWREAVKYLIDLDRFGEIDELESC